MKQFNRVIKVEVSVDTIAQQLLNNMSPDFKHREMVTEAIVSRMLQNDSVGYLYNALNGYPATINFEVGEVIMCEFHDRWIDEDKENGISRDWKEIVQCTIDEIDPYADNKIKVIFDNNGKIQERWVSHLKCSKIPQMVEMSV